MRLECMRAGVLLEREGSGLSDADRLILEAHLESCDGCYADSRALRAMRASAEAAETLPPHARERILSKALSAPVPSRGREAAKSRPKRPWIMRLSLAAAVGAAAGALAIAALFGPQAAPVAPSAEIDRREASPERPPAEEKLAVRSGESVRVGAAEVRASADASMVWLASEDTLVLESGAVEVALLSTPSRPYRVLTDRLSVEVLRARFQLDRDTVAVADGAVRVRDPQGGTLVELLSSGRRYSLDAPPRADVVRAVERPRPATAKSKPLPSAASPAIDAPAKPVVAAILAGARRALSQGDVSGARALVREARSEPRVRPEDAEADTIEAECAVVSGDRAAAVRLYDQIAQRFGDLKAGEIAMFTAARLAAEMGHREEAAARFRDYLARHPRGAFQEEAEARIRSLAPERRR